MGLPAQYAIGAFIQSLDQNPGIEAELERLGPQAHVYFGTGLGDLPTIYDISIEIHEAQSTWDRFWCEPEHNSLLRAYFEAPESFDESVEVPADPDSVGTGERRRAEDAWWSFWAARSPELRQYLSELAEIEAVDVEGEVEAGKKAVIRKKRLQNAKLNQRWGAPTPPWDCNSAGIVWNIHNTPASQISMMGRITGLTFAPVGACATFGVALKLAINAIRLGEAKAVVVGAADPPPHPLSVAAFYNARVISADGETSKPLTGLRGTHVSGGAALWIVGDYDYMTAHGFVPVGLEPLSVGVSSDADHMITPSEEGPLQAINEAIAGAGIDPAELSSWDLHATATPGDFLEVQNLLSTAPDSILITARKGTFGHGMGASGGWELTAQYMGLARGESFATSLTRSELNSEIERLHQNFAFDKPVAVRGGVAGKLSMGVGGVNACVVSRPWR